MLPAASSEAVRTVRCRLFLTNERIVLGYRNDGKIYLQVSVFDLTVKDDLGKVAPSCILDFNADPAARIKCVAYGGPSEKMGCHFLVTGTSEGVVSVWLINAANDADKPKQLAKQTAGCRLTACTVFRDE